MDIIETDTVRFNPDAIASQNWISNMPVFTSSSTTTVSNFNTSFTTTSGYYRQEWAPWIEIQKSEEKYGRWIWHREPGELFQSEDREYCECSECGELWQSGDRKRWDTVMNYCPNCGVKMRK